MSDQKTPLFVKPTRAVFRVAKDKSGFLLDVESLEHPPIEMRFRAGFARDLLVQIEALVRNLEADPDGKPRIDPKAH